MDIKDLNKPQLILFALLLSFVASIATSIVTVSLMQQAPPSIIAPINRVIEQTVEKIQQVEGKTTVQTVVVKEEDLVVDAIAKNQSSIFLLTKEVIDELGKTVEVSAGRGFVLNKEGIFVADAALVSNQGVYYAKNNGDKFKINFLAANEGGFVLMKIGESADSKIKLEFKVPEFGNIDEMKVGQKIIVLDSSVSSSVFDGNKNLNFSVSRSGGGGMVLNLDGNILGMVSFDPNSSFVSIDFILKALKAEEAPKTS
ncbi:hypothetical protein A3D42_03325 [Candidatus Nomurabacteria bacterium RIFCSPHIGHO2_02_FULL_41_18]|uniref:Serine protease n=1 Tax=Candidatus Nomurabacteria bacterium RIFCSPHIGHO2_02_FULL_41_18 TaxID=1801754 RepID=A0A1F6W808_9BACT|nr:MAG: hypothetical protein A2737_00155 [Candidatus Nomurabacteria bacterium RIFCSPHIGHO2_01_FULL_41_71]OGI77916.1 MAG: hypothetical protein A3D42_03325 [Candidatus Nomurabacteria bacterium RIFCSPHIGHO2_02_FULL_41_18]OGI90331.1 MAG: hypothetical protein A3B01_01240 [Candidatus Nomurabacteria bacterium RIFCSPLOWO2_01_FULL_41_52b]OGJ00286.1 MAG: hypothetical protein A3I90_01125 [Candidatus Nomurabacteria bacterium RIFCSPLOWO2_02_FULL_41_9]